MHTSRQDSKAKRDIGGLFTYRKESIQAPEALSMSTNPVMLEPDLSNSSRRVLTWLKVWGSAPLGACLSSMYHKPPKGIEVKDFNWFLQMSINLIESSIILYGNETIMMADGIRTFYIWASMSLINNSEHYFCISMPIYSINLNLVIGPQCLHSIIIIPIIGFQCP